MASSSSSSSTRILHAVYALAIFSLVTTATCLTCSFEDIQVTQKPTGAMVSGKTEYRVDLLNACGCTQSNIQLDCTGFKSVESTDPSVVKQIGNRCVVATDGSFIPPFQGAFFNYAWDSEFPFKPLASSTNCSLMD